jgi:hypothetical protein
MNLRKLLLIVVSVGILAGLTACKKNVSVLVFDTPVEQGSASIVIKTTRTDGLSLSDYTLEITGPVSKTETLNGDTYTLENAVAGTYEIRVSKTNFIGTLKTVIVGAIEDNKTVTYNVTLSMTEKRAPVTVNNATGGTITIPPANNSGGSGVGGTAATLVIPPGSIPGGGTTQISITPVPTSVIDNPQSSVPSGGLGGFSFLMEPSGLVFEEPVTLNFTMDLPATVAQNVPFFMIYRLPDGNFSTDPIDKVPVSFDDQGTLASVQISHFSEWVVGADFEMRSLPLVQKFKTLQASNCEQDFSEYFTETAMDGLITSSITGVEQTEYSVSALIAYVAEPNTTYMPVVSYFEHTYTLNRLMDGFEMERFTLPEGPVSWVSGQSFCTVHGGTP